MATSPPVCATGFASAENGCRRRALLSMSHGFLLLSQNRRPHEPNVYDVLHIPRRALAEPVTHVFGPVDSGSCMMRLLRKACLL
jgi:hypothetical protein